MAIRTLNFNTGYVQVLTLGQFMSRLKLNVIDEFAKQYNQKVGEAPSDAGHDLTTSTYKRAIAYLKENSDNFKDSLLEHLNKVEGSGETFEQVVENGAIESMNELGSPDSAVIVEGELLILTSKDFEVWLKFDESGKVFGAIPCFNTKRNLRLKTDWSKVNLKMSALLPKGALKEQQDAADKEIEKALKVLDKLKKSSHSDEPGHPDGEQR